MKFLKTFLRNLSFLFLFGSILFIIAPDMMKQVFQLYGALFGPLVIVIIIVTALPRKKREKH